MNRGLGQVVILYILHCLRSRHLSRVQILHEKTFLRVRPEGAVIEVARADRIYLDIGTYQLQRKALGQSDAAELSARISAVISGAFQSGFGIDLNNVKPECFIRLMLGFHNCGSVLSRVEISDIIHLCHEGKSFRSQILQAARLQYTRVRYKNIDTAEMFHCPADHGFHGRGIRYIHLQADCALPESLRGFSCLSVIEVRQNHAGSLPVHLLCDSKTEALGSACDYRNLACQTSGCLGTVVNVFLCILLCFC